MATEAYLGFRKPCIARWSDKLDLFFDDPEEAREIQKFADDSSHLQGLSRALQQPNFLANAQSSVSRVIDALALKGDSHYRSLCSVIGVQP